MFDAQKWRAWTRAQSKTLESFAAQVRVIDDSEPENFGVEVDCAKAHGMFQCWGRISAVDYTVTDAAGAKVLKQHLGVTVSDRTYEATFAAFSGEMRKHA